MFEDNNLNRPRPAQWTQGSLFPFIEECWSNSVAVVGNCNVVAARHLGLQQVRATADRGVDKPVATRLRG
jgi:hypothetical protein